VEEAGTSICLVMKAVLLSARWASGHGSCYAIRDGTPDRDSQPTG